MGNSGSSNLRESSSNLLEGSNNLDCFLTCKSKRNVYIGRLHLSDLDKSARQLNLKCILGAIAIYAIVAV